MSIYKKIYPLLSYNSFILGIISIVVGLILLIYIFIYKNLNLDIPLWLLAFGLFCNGYRKEKNEKDEDIDTILKRYHAFRISLVLTTVLLLIACASFIFSKAQVKITALHTLLIIWIIFNSFYLTIKSKDKNRSSHEN